MYPEVLRNFLEYQIPKKQTAPVGQVYLGTFLAFTLFFSFFFGNILFFLIVLIISVFIFLEKEVSVENEWGNISVGFYQDGFHFAKKDYHYKDVLSFTMHEEIFGEPERNLRITFKSPSRSDLFIHIPEDVQKEDVYDIIRKSVKENPNKELSLTDQIVLKFF